MNAEILDAHWHTLTEEVVMGMREWRVAHPTATFAEIEAAIDERLNRVRARMVEEAALASAAARPTESAEAERPRCPDCGQRLVGRGQHTRQVTVQGNHQVQLPRGYTTCPACGAGLFPLDEQLARSAESLSPRLVESIVRLGTWMPFERVPAELAFFTGVVIDVDTARRLTEQAGAALVRLELAEVERLEREQPEAPAGPAVQQLSADGAMVPLVRGEWAEVKTVAVGTVSQERPPTGAVGGHTHDISDCSRLADHETFGRLALGELHRRGTPTAGVVVGVMDGSEWLQGFLDLHRPDAVRILDFPHAVEHLAAAAQASFGSGTLLATTWLEDQRHTLRHGEVAEVLAAVCRLPTPLATDPVHAEVVRDQTLTYLVKRWEQIQYAVFAQQGYPLGSGMVESANKLVVEARLKGSGMHWARVNVNPLVALRAMVCRDRWEASWPRIGRQLREQSATRRRQRRAAKTVAATVVPSATPVLQQPAPPGVDPPVVALRRVPTIVNGRPTARHPWKRPLLAAGRHHNAAHAKS